MRKINQGHGPCALQTNRRCLHTRFIRSFPWFRRPNDHSSIIGSRCIRSQNILCRVVEVETRISTVQRQISIIWIDQDDASTIGPYNLIPERNWIYIQFTYYYRIRFRRITRETGGGSNACRRTDDHGIPWRQRPYYIIRHCYRSNGSVNYTTLRTNRDSCRWSKPIWKRLLAL